MWFCVPTLNNPDNHPISKVCGLTITSTKSLLLCNLTHIDRFWESGGGHFSGMTLIFLLHSYGWLFCDDQATQCIWIVQEKMDFIWNMKCTVPSKCCIKIQFKNEQKNCKYWSLVSKLFPPDMLLCAIILEH